MQHFIFCEKCNNHITVEHHIKKIDELESHNRAEEWEYEPWNKEPIIPEFLWKEGTND